MAKRKSLIRNRRNSRHQSGSPIGSGFLDPDTSIVNEEQTFWWNHLQENTFAPHSLIYNDNETVRHLSDNSEIHSSKNHSDWWKNLDTSNSKLVASTSSGHNLSAAVHKSNIVQISTSDSEKELDLKKKRVRLKTARRKSSSNAFVNALNDTEKSIPLKLRMKRANYSNFHGGSDRKVSQGRLQENEDDSYFSPTGKILKSRLTIFRKRRGDTEDQNAFQDILTQDSVLNDNTARKSVVLEKESSKRSIHRNIDTNKDRIDDQKKAMTTFQAMPLENIETASLNVENAALERNADVVASSDDSDIIIPNKNLKLKNRFMQRVRKSIGGNAFADALADNTGTSSPTSDPNKENDIHDSPVKSQSLFSPSKRSVNRSTSEINTMPKNLPIRKSPRLSSNTAENQSVDVTIQAKGNVEANSSSSSFDNNKSRGMKRSVFFKSKSRNLENSRKSLARNLFGEIIEGGDDISARKSNISTKDKRSSSNAAEKQLSGITVLAKDNVEANSSSSFLDNNESREIKRSVFLKSRSRNLENSRKSLARNLFEEIIEGSDDISAKKSNVLTKDKKSSSNAAEKQLSGITVQAKDDVDSSSSFLDNNESRGIKRSVFVKSKSRNLENSRKSSTRNLFKEIIERGNDISARKSNVSTKDERSSSNIIEKQSSGITVLAKDNVEANSSSSSFDNNESRGMKRSVFLKSRSRNLENSRKSSTRNLFEEIIEGDDDISVRKSNVSTKDNRASLERDDTVTRTSQVHPSSTTEKSPQAKRSKTTVDESSYDMSLVISSNIEKSLSDSSSMNNNKRSIDDDITNVSKTISQKSAITEKQISPSRKFIREETLLEHTHAILSADRANTPETKTYEIVSDDSHADIDIEHDSSIERLSKSIRSETSEPNIEVTDNSHNDSNRERDSSVPKQLSKLNSSTEARLTRNSSRNQSEIPKLANAKVIDNSRNDLNRERDSSVSKQLFKLNSSTEARLTRNSSRNRVEIPKLANAKVIDNSRNDLNRERDSSVSKQLSKLNSSTEARLTRNSSRNRVETTKLANVKVIDNSRNDSNRGRDSSVPKRLSKLTPSTEARLTRNSSINRSEILEPDNEEVVDNSHNNSTRKLDSSVSKQLSKLRPDKEAYLTRKSLINRSEILEPINEEVVDVNEEPEINIDSISQIVSSTRISKVNANMGTRKSTIQSTETETIEDEDADPSRQTIQRNITSTRAETSYKTVNRQSAQSSNRMSIKNDKEIAQKGLSKSQSYRSTSIKSSSKDISLNKQNSSKASRKIDDFFKVKPSSTTMEQSSERAQKSQMFDSEKMEKIKTELEKLKNREMAKMKLAATKIESSLKAKVVKSIVLKQATKKKPPTKVVDKAFLVNGKIYKAPKLPRPKHWATNRLYKFLWDRMESKYKLATRVKSEKFMQELAKVVTVIERRKEYKNYKNEMKTLMKEMARLGIINTPNDFYLFCQDFLPYEFRVKVVPMLLPGNKNNIPYDPEKLHIPILDIQVSESSKT